MRRCTATNSEGRRCCLFEAHTPARAHLTTNDVAPTRAAIQRILLSFGVADFLLEDVADIAEAEGYGVDELIRRCAAYMALMLQGFEHLKRGRIPGLAHTTQEERHDALLDTFRPPPGRPLGEA